MERKDIVSIGDVLRECLEKSRMQERLDEVRACDSFALVVGPGIAASCGRPSMRNGLMTVTAPSAALRSDLNMGRSRIMKGINDIMGKEVVRDLYFR